MRIYNLEKPLEYFERHIPARDEGGEKVDIFLGGFSDHTLNRMSGMKLDMLIEAYRKADIKFRLVQPLPVCLYEEKYDLRKSDLAAPDGCSICPYRPKITDNNLIRLCNGAQIRPRRSVGIDKAFGSVGRDFPRLYEKSSCLRKSCQTCGHLASGKCKAYCVRQIFRDTDRFIMDPVLQQQPGADGSSVCVEPKSGSITAMSDEDLEGLRRQFSKEVGFTMIPAPDYPEIVLLGLHAKGILSVNGKDFYGTMPGTELSGFMVELEMSNSCNLRCRYCETQGGVGPVMEHEVMEKVTESLAGMDLPRIVVLFHGGEPFLHPELIEEFIRLLEEKDKRYPGKYQFGAQTNGTCFNDEVIALIKRHDIKIGLSIDGPRKVQDRNRIFADGSSSFDSVMGGIARLRKENIPFGALAVVTDTSWENISGICEFFIENKIGYAGLKPYYDIGRHLRPDFSPAEFKEMAESIAKAYHMYKGRLELDNINGIAGNLLTRMREHNCIRSPNGCGRLFMTVSHDGGIYPCNQFYCEGSTKLGNIKEMALKDALASKACKELSVRTVDNISACKGCIYRQVCCGGCTYQSLRTYGNLESPGLECAYNKRLIELLIPMMKGRLSIYDW